MSQTTLKSFVSPTAFDADDALVFPSTDGIMAIVNASSAASTIPLPAQTRYVVINATADCYVNFGTTSISATVPTTTDLTGGAGWLIKAQGASDRGFAVQNVTGMSLVASSAVKATIACYTD